MSIYYYFLFFVLAASTIQAQTKFPMGDGLDKWGVPLKVPESELSLRLGARFQAMATMLKEEDLDAKTESTSQDLFFRRVRFQLEGKLGDKATFNMDLRNDNANRGDSGEGNFQVGDAYVQLPLSKGELISNLRLYRAKVDLSRSQTVSSSELLFLNRAYVADEAANFVSHNRRATNIQLLGNLYKKLSYQLVLGDGVQSEDFNDAKGEALSNGSIEKQNFMIGGKLRFHPFSGWEDVKLTETYFGEGKHFSIGVGAFNTSNIRFVDENNEGNVSRTLYNIEASAHYGEWSLQAEYFNMDGVIESFEATEVNKGRSEGWYVQGEKVFEDFHFLAPFARYELWDRFIDGGDYQQESSLYGINWYLNGNRFRVALAYERVNQGRDIEDSKMRSEAFHLTSMWHF